MQKNANQVMVQEGMSCFASGLMSEVVDTRLIKLTLKIAILCHLGGIFFISFFNFSACDCKSASKRDL